MQNRRYETVIASQHDGLWLTVDVISSIYPNEQILYSVKMSKLRYDELDLHSGRFVNYYGSELDHKVVLRHDFKSYSTVYKYFDEMTDWIQDNALGKWDFSIRMEHVSQLTFIWTFENLIDALRFRLSF